MHIIKCFAPGQNYLPRDARRPYGWAGADLVISSNQRSK